MMMCFSRMISTAAKCSLVCGCGQGSLPAMSSRAPSITAAPFSIVAIRMSCPGQSTKLTCLRSSRASGVSGCDAAEMRRGALRAARGGGEGTACVLGAPQQFHPFVLEPGHLAQRAVLLGRAVGAVAGGARAGRVLAGVDLGVRIAQLDRDVALQLVLEPHLQRGVASLETRRKVEGSEGAPSARPRWPSQRWTCRAPRGRWCLRAAGRRGRQGEVRGAAAPAAAPAGDTRCRLLLRCAPAGERVRRQQQQPRSARARAAHAPMLMVACLLMTSGDSGVSLLTSSVSSDCSASPTFLGAAAADAMVKGGVGRRPPPQPAAVARPGPR